jgi:hypothetical protein
MDRLWPLRDKLENYRSTCVLYFWIGYFQSTFEGGPDLSPSLFKKLGDFGVELSIRCYFSPGENDHVAIGPSIGSEND